MKITDDIITLDTETCGFHGPIVTIQYAYGFGDIKIFEVWREPVKNTLALIEEIADHVIVGFNLTFDWFHLCQMYTTLKVYVDKWPTLIDHIPVPEMYAECEPLGRDLDCLKPQGACDVMLSARKTKYQALMDHNPIFIMGIPNETVDLVRQELNKRLPFKPIYFENMSKQDSVWKIQESKRKGFSNLYVRFAPSTRLKALAKDALGVEDPLTLKALAPPRPPLEIGYAPYALALKKLDTWKGKGKKWFKGEWKGAWPDVIENFIEYWGFNEKARQYAIDDVKYTRLLAEDLGVMDEDSDLACMVGAVRWRGFKIDLEEMQVLKQRAEEIAKNVPTAPTDVKRWLKDAMDETEALGLPSSTNKEALMAIMQWDEIYPEVDKINRSGLKPSERLKALSNIKWTEEVSRRAFLVYEARRARKEIEGYQKFLIADRFHASFKVIGTLSTRMSGTDSLNAHGIKKAKYVRKVFPLAFDGFELSGGDFSAFEVAIAAAVYDDPKLYEDLTSFTDCPWGVCERCNYTGKERTKIHAIFGTHIFPGLTYNDVRKSEGQVPDYYTLAKSGLFTWLFAGTEHAFRKNLGIPENQAKNGLLTFNAAYPSVGEKRERAMKEYSILTQPEGIGSKVYWNECKNYTETLLGFKRFFDLEIQVIKCLYNIVEDPPDSWNIDGYVQRRDRKQTMIGATRSSLISAAFALQSKIQRVAINHPIQGTGAQITKLVQKKIWDLQPSGYNPWEVIPMNIHDEIMVPNKCSEKVAATVATAVEEYRSVVPLLKIEWQKQMLTWADK